MKHDFPVVPVILLSVVLSVAAGAQVPHLIHYQGRVIVDGTNHDGTGLFKFALVGAGGTNTYWNNDGTSAGGSEPAAAVQLTVSKGLYAVLLGDTTRPNMQTLPPAVFEHDDVWLRVWFDDGTHGFQRLSPDQRIAAVGYAMMAGSVPDGSITGAKLATNAAAENLGSSGLGGVAGGGMVMSFEENPALVAAGYVKSATQIATVESWRRFNSVAFPGRYQHTAVWTGSEILIWGDNYNYGIRFHPATDTWRSCSTTNSPTGSIRLFPTAIWTGTEMIAWGGFSSGSTYPRDGGRYDPATDTWTPISTNNAPAGRYFHTAVWTGMDMIVWGGYGSTGLLGDGARYNRDTDTLDAPADQWRPRGAHVPHGRVDRHGHDFWGGENTGVLSTGGRYNLASNSWISMSTSGQPTARSRHTAVWSGSEMIVWGGSDRGDGGRYNPATNTWRPIDTYQGPVGRTGHSAVMANGEMIVWGGMVFSSSTFLNSGGRYDLTTGRWTPLSLVGAPPARYAHTAVWTGNEMIVWGGSAGLGDSTVTYGLTPGQDLHLYQRP